MNRVAGHCVWHQRRPELQVDQALQATSQSLAKTPVTKERAPLTDENILASATALEVFRSHAAYLRGSEKLALFGIYGTSGRVRPRAKDQFV